MNYSLSSPITPSSYPISPLTNEATESTNYIGSNVSPTNDSYRSSCASQFASMSSEAAARMIPFDLLTRSIGNAVAPTQKRSTFSKAHQHLKQTSSATTVEMESLSAEHITINGATTEVDEGKVPRVDEAQVATVMSTTPSPTGATGLPSPSSPNVISSLRSVSSPLTCRHYHDQSQTPRCLGDILLAGGGTGASPQSPDAKNGDGFILGEFEANIDVIDQDSLITSSGRPLDSSTIQQHTHGVLPQLPNRQQRMRLVLTDRVLLLTPMLSRKDELSSPSSASSIHSSKNARDEDSMKPQRTKA